MWDHYPEMMPTPFEQYLTGTERSDIWRLLVLHAYGGVYADIDVQCLVPIDEWNAQYGHDAQVLLGVEYYGKNGADFKTLNWAVAAMPGNALLGRVPAAAGRVLQEELLDAARRQTAITQKVYVAGILKRTGPLLLSRLVHEFFEEQGVPAANMTLKSVQSPQGLAAGGVRILDVDYLARGAAVAGRSGPGVCDKEKERFPAMLTCHLFWGSWKAALGRGQVGKMPNLTYTGCRWDGYDAGSFDYRYSSRRRAGGGGVGAVPPSS